LCRRGGRERAWKERPISESLCSLLVLFYDGTIFEKQSTEVRYVELVQITEDQMGSILLRAVFTSEIFNLLWRGRHGICELTE
jgi:hypothetical protein